MPIATVNPASGVTEKVFEPHSDAEVDARLQAADRSFRSYRRNSFTERARWMTSAADILEGELPDVASLLTTEMGKTFASAKAEVAKCALGLRYFAEHAESFLADEVVDSNRRAVYQPIGPVLAVMPWNFPLWQVVRFAAPALMAGNVGLLKHASNVPQTALFIEDLFRRAGFPIGVFQTLLVGSESISRVISDDRVRAVTLTGSEGAGRAVAEVAARALKKSVLELGGSDAFVVLSSADIERAATVGVQARVQNNGQSCIAAKRFVVHQDVYEQFEEAFVEKMVALVVGDPMDASTEVGPLALRAVRAEVSAQVEDARSCGARVLCGGAVLEGEGFYYSPTVLAGIEAQMRVHLEEVFGPVAMLYKVRDLEEAIVVANDSRFGLGASVWTRDPKERDQLIEELQVGLVFVNSMVASSPELPFGGTKRSGYGRELSAHGIREFCELKSVSIA